MNAIEPRTVQCPTCWEAVELLVDCSAGAQTYTEDCAVCCRPMRVMVQVGGGRVEVVVEAE